MNQDPNDKSSESRSEDVFTWGSVHDPDLGTNWGDSRDPSAGAFWGNVNDAPKREKGGEHEQAE